LQMALKLPTHRVCSVMTNAIGTDRQKFDSLVAKAPDIAQQIVNLHYYDSLIYEHGHRIHDLQLEYYGDRVRPFMAKWDAERDAYCVVWEKTQKKPRRRFGGRE